MSANPSSTFTVGYALVVNLVVAAAKLVAAALTGSTAMLAESLHAFADSGNEGLLLVAQRRAGRSADAQHPLGHGREAYFWSLLASLGVFFIGAFVSVRQGVMRLIHPVPASDFTLAYVVLALSFVLEGLSLRQAYHHLNDEAERFDRDFFEQLLLTSDPTTRAVFAEDAAAVAGNVIAAFGVGAHQLTGSAVPDAGAGILIGVLLGGVAIELTKRNRDFLIGEPASAAIREQIARTVAAQPGVVAIRELIVTFVGPRQLWVVTRVDLDDGLGGAEVEHAIRQTESAVRELSPFILRIDVVPAGP